MLSVLLITAALALQYPPPAQKPATDTSAARRPATTTRTPSRNPQATAPRETSPTAAVSRNTFHDRMRDLWTDQVVYTRNVIISVSAGLGDTAVVTQRLLRNQDEIGEAIKPYYGDEAGTQLASLLRNHIQLAAKALVAAKGTSTAMGMNMQDSSNGQLLSQANRVGGDTVKSRSSDTTQIKSNAQYPTNAGRLNDTTKTSPTARTDTARNRSQYPSATARANERKSDTTRIRPPANARIQGSDTSSSRTGYPTARSNDTTQNRAMAGAQATTVDSTALNQAIAELKANADSIALFLNKANPRGFAAETMKGALQQHITLLLQEVTAQLKKDWQGSVAAFDESQHQILQMADMLSDGIMKQFPSRFNNKVTTVSSR